MMIQNKLDDLELERVSTALRQLKNELVQLRQVDRDLLRKFLNMNKHIHRLKAETKIEWQKAEYLTEEEEEGEVKDKMLLEDIYENLQIAAPLLSPEIELQRRLQDELTKQESNAADIMVNPMATMQSPVGGNKMFNQLLISPSNLPTTPSLGRNRVRSVGDSDRSTRCIRDSLRRTHSSSSAEMRILFKETSLHNYNHSIVKSTSDQSISAYTSQNKIPEHTPAGEQNIISNDNGTSCHINQLSHIDITCNGVSIKDSNNNIEIDQISGDVNNKSEDTAVANKSDSFKEEDGINTNINNKSETQVANTSDSVKEEDDINTNADVISTNDVSNVEVSHSVVGSADIHSGNIENTSIRGEANTSRRDCLQSNPNLIADASLEANISYSDSMLTCDASQTNNANDDNSNIDKVSNADEIHLGVKFDTNVHNIDDNIDNQVSRESRKSTGKENDISQLAEIDKDKSNECSITPDAESNDSQIAEIDEGQINTNSDTNCKENNNSAKNICIDDDSNRDVFTGSENTQHNTTCEVTDKKNLREPANATFTECDPLCIPDKTDGTDKPYTLTSEKDCTVQFQTSDHKRSHKRSQSLPLINMKGEAAFLGDYAKDTEKQPETETKEIVMVTSEITMNRSRNTLVRSLSVGDQHLGVQAKFLNNLPDYLKAVKLNLNLKYVNTYTHGEDATKEMSKSDNDIYCNQPDTTLVRENKNQREERARYESDLESDDEVFLNQSYIPNDRDTLFPERYYQSLPKSFCRNYRKPTLKVRFSLENITEQNEEKRAMTDNNNNLELPALKPLTSCLKTLKQNEVTNPFLTWGTLPRGKSSKTEQSSSNKGPNANLLRTVSCDINSMLSFDQKSPLRRSASFNVSTNRRNSNETIAEKRMILEEFAKISKRGRTTSLVTLV